ncbi:hypothetical protein H9P43_004264 [Blastocladiella emersonii ATCC 22665]|nr:hypothetical protein H9P43_004264 [Blastocladiella emersonii ATCC 22665]
MNTTDPDSLIAWNKGVGWDPLAYPNKDSAVLFNSIGIAQAIIIIVLNVALVRTGVVYQLGFNASNMLSLALCSTHIVYGVFILTTKSVFLYNRSWQYVHCQIDAGGNVFFLTALVAQLLVVSAERFLCILRMIKLPNKLVVMAFGNVLALAVGNSMFHMLTVPRPVISASGLFCHPNFGSGEVISTWLTFFDVGVMTANIQLVMVVYSAIVRKLRKSFRKLNKMTGASRSPNAPAGAAAAVAGRRTGPGAGPTTPHGAMSPPHLIKANGGSVETIRTGVGLKSTTFGSESVMTTDTVMTTATTNSVLGALPDIRNSSSNILGGSRQLPAAAGPMRPKRASDKLIAPIRRMSVAFTRGIASLAAPVTGGGNTLAVPGTKREMGSRNASDSSLGDSSADNGLGSSIMSSSTMDSDDASVPSRPGAGGAGQQQQQQAGLRGSNGAGINAQTGSHVARRKKRKALKKLNIEALLMRRGLTIFAAFFSTFILFVIQILMCYFTKHRLPVAFDTTMCLFITFSPLMDPIIIFAMDTNFRAALYKSLPPRLAQLLGKEEDAEGGH